MSRVKLDKPVRFDTSLRFGELFSEIDNAQGTREYELSAILMHSGSAAAGHYFAYIRSAEDDVSRFENHLSGIMVWTEEQTSLLSDDLCG